MSIGAVVHLPTIAGEPALVDDPGMTGLRAVLADRDRLTELDPEWDRRGVYVLLGAGTSPTTYYGYVGEATKNLRKRAGQHRDKSQWTKALLMRRGTEQGFTSTHIGWLEGRLYQILKVADACELANDKTPGDDSVHPSEAEHLEVLAQTICAVLRLLGYSPDPGPAPSTRRTSSGEQVVSHTLSFPKSGVAAQGLLLSDGKTLRVYAGSTAKSGSDAPSLSLGYAARRNELMAAGLLAPEGQLLRLTETTDFPSLSAAASVLGNGSFSGPASWKQTTAD